MIGKTKSVSLMVFSLLTLVAVAGFVSAASLSIDPTSITMPTTGVEHDDGSFVITFDLANDGLASTLDWSGSTVNQGATFSFSHDSIGDGSGGTVTETITVTVSFDEHLAGSLTGNINIHPQAGGDENVPFSVSINDKAELSLALTGTLSETSNGTVVVTNDGNVPLNVDLSETTAFGIAFSNDQITNLLPGEDSADITVSFPANANLDFGDSLVTIKAEDTGESISDEKSFTVRETFCKDGEAGNDLEIRDVNVDNLGQGKDDEWQLLDLVEIEVDVKNTGNDKIKDVFVEMALFDSDGVNVVGDLDFDNTDEEEFDIGNVRDGDTETAKFTFRVPADFTDLGNYKLAIKAYSDDVGESDLCVDTSRDFSNDFFDKIEVVEDPDNLIAVDEDSIKINPSELICGETAFVTLDVYNVGGEGEEDQVLVTMKNSELGIDEEFTIRRNMDDGDKAPVEFTFVVPQGIDAKQYGLEFRTLYDYRSSSDTYRDNSDDTWTAFMKVLQCGPAVPGPSGSKIAAIGANLESDAKAGEDLKVKISVTNLKSEAGSFLVDASGFQSWASLIDVSDTVINLDAGESKDVVFTFGVDKDASGEKAFNVELTSGSDVERKSIAVNIESPSTSGPSLNLGEGNAYLWIIGIVNVVLIILIIIVAVRISRR